MGSGEWGVGSGDDNIMDTQKRTKQLPSNGVVPSA